MCYTVSQLVNKRIKEARKSGESEDFIDDLVKLYNELAEKEEDTYMLGGFTPTAQIPIVIDYEQPKVELADWGLIPWFIKSDSDRISLRRKTLNAKSETLLDRKSFKSAAKGKRCVIALDGFFEYHHLNKKKYPFFIHKKNNAPILLAGIWNDWKNEVTGEIRRTASIVTTEGNDLMKNLHNNPSNPNRMPVILPPENIKDWMTPFHEDEPMEKYHQEYLQDLTRPYEGDDLSYYTVPQLMGKKGVGNTPAATEKLEYEEILELDWYES